MGYVEDLRKLIGNYPIILVGAAALIFDEYSRLLLLRRTDNGCWGIPGGAMEPGESLEEAVRRETREEAGLEIEKVSFFDIFSGPKFYYRYPNGDEVYIVSVVYLSKHFSGILRIDPAEHSEAIFFDLQSLPTRLSPPIIPVIEKLVQNGSF
jgi:ADP-ribose pyrophosphatase YjhB (NUDIX family)